MNDPRAAAAKPHVHGKYQALTSSDADYFPRASNSSLFNITLPIQVCSFRSENVCKLLKGDVSTQSGQRFSPDCSRLVSADLYGGFIEGLIRNTSVDITFRFVGRPHRHYQIFDVSGL